MNKNYNPDVGLSLSDTIFDEFKKRRNSVNELIQLETSDILLKQATMEIEFLVFQLYKDYHIN